jgi:hypothetical protein
LAFLCLTGYAFLLAILNSVTEFGPQPIAVDAMIILAGMFLVFRGIKSPWPTSFSKVFVYYSLIVVGFTVVTGGLSFNPQPTFDLEYASGQVGREVNYSLGISYFFGLSAISAALVMTSESKLRNRFLYGIFCLSFLFLCFLGGGRGETVVTLLLLVIVVLTRLRFIYAASVLSIFIIFGSIAFSSEIVEVFTFYNRFRLLFEGDLSTRDSLLLDVFRLLQNNPQCSIIGCGFGYFQFYYGYGVGLYPHNSIAEAVITFGLPVTIVSVVLYIRGIFVYWKRVGAVDMLLAFSVFAALVSLKSQSLYSSWIFLASFLVFCWIGIAWWDKAANRPRVVF